MSFFSELILIMLSYMGLIVLFFVGLNFFSSGWLFTWLKVKLSRGSKVLISISTVTNDYFKAGVLDKGFLVFKDKAKEERRIALADGCIYRSIGINMITVDDEKSAVLKRDFSAVSGFDAVKHNSLYLRALYKPAIFDSREKILLGVVIVTLLGVAFVGYLVVSQGARIDEVLSVVSKIGSIREVV